MKLIEPESGFKSENPQPMPKRDQFKSMAVHMHYSCDCSNRPKLKLDRTDRVVEIDIQLTCPRCQDGDAEVLIIGGVGIEITGCPNPGCECDEVTLRVPVSEFVAFLKTPVH
jgi:hypothetical protein